MKSRTPSKTISLKDKFLYPLLIFLVWLVTYIFWERLIFVHELAWDEVNYLSLARGIAEDFDFTGRIYTVMGLLKHGYPTTMIIFPIISIYIAVFFKLFGISLNVAYFSTWFAALGVCILLYYIFLMLSENNQKLSFLVSIMYLFSPGTVKNCNTAMMEQFGCFLLCLFVFFILRDYLMGKFTYFTAVKFALAFVVLWMYKTLFIGIFFGAFVFIVSAYYPKITGKKIETKVPLPLFLLISYGFFAILFYILKEYVFPPVAPMMNFSPQQESAQVYADFLGGFFNNFTENIIGNIKFFFRVIIGSYLIYPTIHDQHIPEYASYTMNILSMTSYYISSGLYFFIFFFMIAFTFAFWKKLTPIEKVFVSFALVTILSFNLVFNLLFRTYHINIWRYNYYNLPLYICYLGILLNAGYDYVKPFVGNHPQVSVAVLLIFIVCGYFPLFLSCIKHSLVFEKSFHLRAKLAADLIRSVIKDKDVKFVYNTEGTHTTFVDYPVQWIFKDATNEQLLQINEILPRPIDFLFLRSHDWLYKNNIEKIKIAAPILDNNYVFYGYNEQAKLIVYQYKKQA